MNQLRPYRIGLAVVGLFTLAVALFVIVRATMYKSDLQTERAATKIATKLNDYIYAQQTVPQTLQEAGIKDVPSTISYEQHANSYTFCATYKAAKSKKARSLFVPDYYYENNESLTIPPTHKKGENCQTITPYMYTQSAQQTYETNDSSAPYRTCDTGYSYSWTFLPVTEVKATDGDQPASITIENYPTKTTYNIASQAKTFDKNCNPIGLEDIHSGDNVSLYFNPYGEPVTMILKN